MASFSNSQYCSPRKYDVFLSFRGEDTRRTFTSHLYEGLKNRGIFTFQDVKRLDHGDSIPEELVKAIKESQVSLVVFSKNYGASRWSLNELVEIMERKDKNGQTVIPVFYDVDPSHVRNQTESFGEAFSKHESKYKDDVEAMKKVKRWRTALTVVANLKGYDIRDGIESEKIQLIVDYISTKLCKNVKENAKRNQIHSLQNILLSELLRKKYDYVSNKYEGKSIIPSRLCSMKVLIVLDDIDHSDHLEYLAGDLRWFGNGSRVIVTTRNRHLIEKDDAIYEVPTLPDDEAMQLFNQHAFKKEVPDERFKKFSLELVNYAKGLPLALKVWGLLLHKKGLTQWGRTVDQIKNNSISEIVEKLKISYDGLEPEEQKMFLDIACFFRGYEKKEVIQILQSCDFGVEYGLDVLIDKSLVFISKNDTIEMHDLIQDMGRYVVKMQKDSGEQSRLWAAEDFEEVIVNNTGTKAVEAIWLHYIQNLCLSKKAMKKMKKLRVLYIGRFHTHDDTIEYLPNNLRWFECIWYPWKSLPENFEPKRLVHLDLQYSMLHYLWIGTKHFPSLRRINLNFSRSLIRTPDFTGMPNLEYLNLEGCSNLEEVHHSLGCSRKLIELNLSWCVSLKRFPCVNVESLESLNLQHCSSLEKFPEILGRIKPLELDIQMRKNVIGELPSSVSQHQARLTELDLSFLINIVALPSSIGMLKGLVKLHVRYCSKLEILPEEIGDLENLEKLDASYSRLISQPPASIIRLNKLKFLSFEKGNTKVGHKDGVCFVFPQVNEGLCSLEYLNLNYCNLVDGGLPEDIGSLSSLKELYLWGNNFEHLPRSMSQLGALKFLNLSHCKKLKELPGFTGMPNLETLNLIKCMNLEEIHHSLGFLKNLCRLTLTNCIQLKRFPGLCIDSLKYLCLRDCSSLEEFPEIFGSMKLKSDIHMLDSVLRDLNSMYISFPRSLSQDIVSLQQGIISASDSLSLRVFTVVHCGNKIPSWFHHRGTGKTVSVNLPENWYVRDELLGFAVCYSGNLIDTTAHLIPIRDEGMPWMTQKLELSSLPNYDTGCTIHFFLVPLASLWDTSTANGNTPNDYGLITFSFSGGMEEYGFRSLYKDEFEGKY
nr:TMV resistance protein N-like isoform X2 [Solanum lycopersicum]